MDDAGGQRTEVRIEDIERYRPHDHKRIDFMVRRDLVPGKICLTLNMGTVIPNDLLKAFLREIKAANDGMNFLLRVSGSRLQLFQKRSAKDNVKAWQELGEPEIEHVEIDILNPNFAQPDLFKSILFLVASKIVAPYLATAEAFNVSIGNEVNTLVATEEWEPQNFVAVEKYVINDEQKRMMGSDHAARSAKLHFTNKERMFPPGIAGLIQSFIGTELPEDRYHKYLPVPASFRDDWESVLNPFVTAVWTLSNACACSRANQSKTSEFARTVMKGLRRDVRRKRVRRPPGCQEE